MLDSVVRFSLKNRLAVLLVSLLLILSGLFLSRQLPVDIFPDLTRPRVTIFLEAEGMAALEVEQYVTRPIETAVNGAPYTISTRSTSSAGFGLVYVEFQYGTDIYLARQIVDEKLQTVTHLPPGIEPKLGPVTSVTGQIMTIGLSNNHISIDSLRLLADYTIRRRLKSISGVAEVIPIGGGVMQYHVNLSSAKMQNLNISLDEVEEVLSKTNINTTGSYVDRNGRRILIRNLGLIDNLDEVKEVVITYRNGNPILLKQIIDSVEPASKYKIGDASMNGEPAVLLVIEKQPGFGTLKLTRDIDLALEELKTSLPEGTEINPNIFRQSEFINVAISNVMESLELGALFVLIVLFLFLMNIRTTFITLLSIPISILVTICIFYIFDLSINTMTLGGLAIAIGELVDDSIVDVENIYQRLKKSKGQNVLKVTLNASLEVRTTIIYSTLIIIFIFAPLFALPGMEGRIFKPLGIAYIVSITASTLVSMTLTPVLASLLLKNLPDKKKKDDSWLVRKLKNIDRGILRHTLKNRPAVIISSVILFLSSLFILPELGSEFLPSFNEGSLTINMVMDPGSSIDESNKMGVLVEKEILKIPEVAFTGRRIGRAELDEHVDPPGMADIEVAFKPGSERTKEEIVNELRARLSKFKGVTFNIGQPISHRLDHLVSGVSADLAIKVYGYDLQKLRKYGENIKAILQSTEGVVDVQEEHQEYAEQLIIKPDDRKIQMYGLNKGEVVRNLETILKGRIVTQIREEEKLIDLVIRLSNDKRENTESIGRIILRTPNNGLVQLKNIADIYYENGPSRISHQDVQRNLTVSCNVDGRDIGSTVEEIRKKINDNIAFESGYFATYEGQFQNRDTAATIIIGLSLVALVLIVLLLYGKFRSWSIVLQIMLSIPFAMIGGLVAIMLTEGNLSIASMIGFIALAGIASRNGLMLVSRYLNLMEEEDYVFGDEMIIQGSLDRLVPVLMTAITAILALIPLLFEPNAPGKEMLYPVAVVLVGGLISSTLLEIIITPVLFKMTGRNLMQKIKARNTEL